MLDTVLPDVRYRPWVLSWPKRLMVYFLYDDDLFRAFSNTVHEVLTEWLQTVLGEPDARPAIMACDLTFGTLLDFRRHLQAVVSRRFPDGWDLRGDDLHSP